MDERKGTKAPGPGPGVTLGKTQDLRVLLAILFVVELSPKLERGASVLVHKNSLASCQWCRHSIRVARIETSLVIVIETSIVIVIQV